MLDKAGAFSIRCYWHNLLFRSHPDSHSLKSNHLMSLVERKFRRMQRDVSVALLPRLSIIVACSFQGPRLPLMNQEVPEDSMILPTSHNSHGLQDVGWVYLCPYSHRSSAISNLEVPHVQIHITCEDLVSYSNYSCVVAE